MKKLLLASLLIISVLGKSQTQFHFEGHTFSPFRTDKSEHAWAGTAISVTTALSCNRFLFHDQRPFSSVCIGFAVGTLIGIFKESIWDKRMGRGVCDNWDAIATGWGSLTGALCVRIYFDMENKKLSLHNENNPVDASVDFSYMAYH